MRPRSRAAFVAFAGVGALVLASSGPVAGGPSSKDFVVDGLALGGAVYPDSSVYKAYTCRPSQDFSGFTWCSHQSERTGKFGRFGSRVMLLHSSSNEVVFITETIVPAFFSPGDADREIERISKRFGQGARVLTADARPGLPHALLAAWGEATLTPLDETALDALRRGEAIHRGLIADFLGDARKSARSGLPVFSIGGGPGFLWGASFDDAGQGSLRSSAVNVDELGSPRTASNPPIVASMNAPRPPILSPNAPSLAITNNSCRNIDTVLIDGAKQLEGIAAGSTGNFHMDGRCRHSVSGMSGVITWSNDIQCEGAPYQSYSLNWIYNNPDSASEAISDNSVIVETHASNYYGQMEITSKADCITITKIVANRENCKVANPEPNRVLKFGETLTVPYFCSKVLEINLNTDQGSSVFTFDR
jgi:hypothetical protein